MPISSELKTLDSAGLQRFMALRNAAVGAVTERFYAAHGTAYERFGQAGRNACSGDIAFHLEFLRPVLEFGLLQPMAEYLHWLASVLAARAIPVEHVALSLDWLADYFSEYMDEPDGAVVAAALRAARSSIRDTVDAPASPLKAPPAWEESIPFENALIAGNQREALSLVNRCLDRGPSLVEVEMHIIQPALYRIGEKWQANQISVAQEHLASSIAQSVMTAGLLRSPPPTLLNKRVLLACIEGNSHAMGLHMVADAFQLAGWEVQYLGANMPSPALIRQVAEWQPDLVCLSVSFPQQLRIAKALVLELKGRCGEKRPLVMIGGLAINRFDKLTGEVGADAYSPDAATAVSLADRMFTGQAEQ